MFHSLSMLLYFGVHKLTVASIPAPSLTTEATFLLNGELQKWVDGRDFRYNGIVWDGKGYELLTSSLL